MIQLESAEEPPSQETLPPSPSVPAMAHVEKSLILRADTKSNEGMSKAEEDYPMAEVVRKFDRESLWWTTRLCLA